jgi:hypothetical protein
VYPEVMNHGASAYSAGCRCDECTEANTVRMARARAKRSAQVAAGAAMISAHGASAYRNWGCRCETCKRSNSHRIATSKQRNFAARIMIGGRLVAPRSTHGHGHVDTYARFGCRCGPCAQVKAEAKRSLSA